MNYAQLLKDVEEEVKLIYVVSGTSSLPYHNLAHVALVVDKAVEMGRYYELSDIDYFIVVTAAWFHDSGYLNGTGLDHERRSGEIAGEFLRSRDVNIELINRIANCILATRMPQQPKNLLEQIVCDADLFHLGTAHFRALNKKMKKEAGLRSGKKIPKGEWLKGTLNLLESHHYHTDYVKKMLDKTKQENINGIKLKLSESKNEKKIVEDSRLLLTANTAGNKPNDDEEKQKRPDRGIETMFRISSNNHQRLSDMADNKANIMITTTSIILSILLSLLLRKLEDNQHLVIPAILLLAICVITMVFSILATRPALPGGRFTKQDIDEKKTNLLFFGNFYKMSYEDYSSGMKAMMKDREFLYGSLTRDVYSQGIVLGRKYWLLRIAYNVFMYGIICSVLAFVIAVMATLH